MSRTSDKQVPHLAHHFETVEQQDESATLGMWIFLVTEVMFFGGLFAVYATYFFWYPEVYEHASLKMNLWLGATNTVVLLASSFTMVLAVHFCRHAHRKAMLWCLGITLALAGCFLVIKGIEYYQKYDHGLFIGRYFLYDAPDAKQMHLFLCLYFFMTGLHAIHVVIGIGLIAWLLFLGVRGKLGPHRYLPAEMTGLYWHFVDLIWVFLFPLLYLMGVR